MIRNLKIFWLYSTFSARTAFQHRIGVVSFLSGKLLRFLFSLLFIFFLVSRTKLFAGYSLNQTLIFFLTFNLIDSAAQLLFREVYRFRPLVINGELDGVLLKPYHPFLRVLIGGVDILDTITIIPFFALLIYFILQIPHITFLNTLLYSGYLINGILLAAGFHIIILSIGVLTTEVDNITLIYRDFTKMVSLPIDMYKEPLRSFLMFGIPVGIMIALPSKVLFGLLTLNLFVISMMISAVFISFSMYLWNMALKKYQSVGS